MTAEKTREDRLRRKAARQGLTLQKSRRRDPDARDFGRYWLWKVGANTLRDQPVAGSLTPDRQGRLWFGLTLDDVEQFLNGGQQ